MQTPTRRVLIVDDQEFMTSLLAMAFRDRGFDIGTANDGKQALAEAAARPPDAVLLDVMMPEFDGWQVLAALRRDRRTSRVPVVMMSAAADARYPRRALQSAALFLSKPFSLPVLVETVEALLSTRGDPAAA